MPTYFARGVSARLGAMPLADAVSPNIILRKGEAAKQQSDTAETKLRGSKMLKEVQVPFPGDEEQYRLNWLGDAPFMQTQVGEDLFGDTDVSTPPEAKALVLHVILSDRTYISGLRNQKTSLKIDVFFNGQLSSCWFMSTHDVKSGVRGHHQVFAGTRVDFLAERPWIILPQGVAPDGSSRKNTASVSVGQRWQDICRALQDEARERGTNADGEVPPTAKFLDALSTMHMPNQVRDMQKPTGTAFGTIDIIITAGEGKKLTSGVGYLKAPKRMLDENFPLKVARDGAATNLPQDGFQQNEDGTEHHHYKPSPEIVDVDAEGDSDPEYDIPSKRQALMSSRLSMQETGETSDSQPRLISHSTSQGFKSQSSSSPTIATPDQHTVSPPSIVTSSGNAVNMPSFPVLGREQLHHHDKNNVQYRPSDGAQGCVNSENESHPQPSFNIHTPQMHPPRYVDGTRQGVGGTPSSHPSYQTLLPNAASESSSVDCFFVSFLDPSLHPMFPFAEKSGVDSARFGSSPYPVPFSAPEQECRSSFSTHSSPPGCHPFGLGTYFSGRPDYLSSVPNTLPNLFGHHGNGPPPLPFSHFNYRAVGSFPPSALYSVPTKPKRSISPQKDRVPMEAQRNASRALISRVVIFGEDKSILVDRQLHPPRSIVVEEKGSGKVEALYDSPKDVEKVAESAKHEEMSNDLCKSGKITARTEISPVVLSAGHANVVFSNGAGEHDTSAIDSFHDPLHPKGISGRAIKQMPTRRTSSWNSIRGVQGPKANPFWFEDPEEMLREASAQRRRSCSPNKRCNNPAVALPVSTSEKRIQDNNLLTSVTSSPLSSLHTTPEPDVELMPGDRQLGSVSSSASFHIPQTDGSGERQLFRSLNSLIRTPNSKGLQPTTVTPRIEHYAKSTSQSSASKKRKAPHRTVTKEPRNSNRLRTCGNPVLNQNCVIAYAESKNEDEEQGILRQVRSERQGVFQEEYVVFAARFFVGE